MNFQWTIALTAVLSLTVPLSASALSTSTSPAGPQGPHISNHGHVGASFQFPTIPTPPPPVLPPTIPPPTTNPGPIGGGGNPGGGGTGPIGGGGNPGGGGSNPGNGGGSPSFPGDGSSSSPGTTNSFTPVSNNTADVGFLHPSNKSLQTNIMDIKGKKVGSFNNEVIQVAGGIVNAEDADPKTARAILLVTSGRVLNLTESPEVAALKAEDLSDSINYSLSRTSLRPVVRDLYYTAAGTWRKQKANDLSVIYLNFVSPY